MEVCMGRGVTAVVGIILIQSQEVECTWPCWAKWEFRARVWSKPVLMEWSIGHEARKEGNRNLSHTSFSLTLLSPIRGHKERAPYPVWHGCVRGGVTQFLPLEHHQTFDPHDPPRVLMSAVGLNWSVVSSIVLLTSLLGEYISLMTQSQSSHSKWNIQFSEVRDGGGHETAESSSWPLRPWERI